MITKVFLILLLSLSALSLFCDKQPQRQGWISFKAFSNMDDIADVFEAINENITKRNESVNVGGKVYSFADFQLRAWYNTANQQQSYVNDTVSKVQCGKLTLTYDFKYSIEGGKNGTASGHVVASPFSFKKSLFINGGALAWDLVSSDTIAVESQKLILRSDPVFSDSDKKVFEDLLNYHTQNKSTVFNISIQDLNQRYKNDLKQFLQQQHIVVVNNQEYSYGDVNITYLSAIKDQKLTNIGFKGLRFTCFFELQNYTNKCVDLPTQHIQDYGGLQEIIAFPWLQANLLYLAKNKYFDMKLNPHIWQSNQFQFFIGDVANVIQYARKDNPSDAITIECSWDSDQQNQTFVDYFTFTTIYIQVPLKCVIKSKDTTIQTVRFVMVNVLDFAIGTSNLFVKVKKVQIIKVKYQSAGQYIVTKQQLANYLLLSIANNLKGKSVFGNGFKTTQRRAPSLIFKRDYLVMFDASEI